MHIGVNDLYLFHLIATKTYLHALTCLMLNTLRNFMGFSITPISVFLCICIILTDLQTLEACNVISWFMILDN